MTKITRFDAVVSLVGGGLAGNDEASNINYIDGQTPPSDAEIDAEVIRLQAVRDAQEYARNRQPEYPTIAELTIALYDTDDKAALETKRAAVKTKWPKNNKGPIE